MKRAYIAIRAEPHYRRDAFVAGLRAVGYDVRFGAPQEYTPETVFVSWNRYEPHHAICSRVEKFGGAALIAENGYIGGPHDGGDYYALAIGGHNGSGRWHAGGPERWNALGVELKPWRTEGDHILVCPNRSFGRPDTIMPLDWARSVRRRLEAVTKRPIRVRQHPMVAKPARSLEEDLRGAHACVIWGSSVGVRALVEGIPVICESPYWICREAALTELGEYWSREQARSVAMVRLAWAQWTVDEIATGEPFRYLLSDTRQAQSAAPV